MESPSQITRRDALRTLAAVSVAAGSAAAAPRAAEPARGPGPESPVERNDAAVRRLLAQQLVDPASPGCGCVPDSFGFHTAGSASGVVETMAASFVHPESAFHRDAELRRRIDLAAGFLERAQTPEGNVDLLVTNFNSPPDTGFVTHNVATAAAIARRGGAEDIAERLRPFLEKAGAAMAVGGIHTPNHRWVVSAALAQVHELFPDPRYVARIDEWLAEGIDIDADGQFIERSTLTYNPITDRALVVIATKLKRPALLDPVRRNLRALTWLLHADGEVVTEISKRQDQYTRGNVARYWFPLTFLARLDKDGQFATLARQAEPTGARLSTLLEYPELGEPLVPSQPLPDDFVKEMPAIGITRIRRGPRSATLLLGGSSRLLTLRSGEAVLEGLRMASAFFGKAQFIPDTVERRDKSYVLRQKLEAPYYQPVAERVAPDAWLAVRERRKQSEICHLEQTVEITETKRGLEVRLRAHGTDGVPVAVELSFRPGGELTGCSPLEGEPDCALLAGGTATYRVGRDAIRVGPGAAPHRYTQVRGAESRLLGQSVYVTGFTPFDHTLVFECD